MEDLNKLLDIHEHFVKEVLKHKEELSPQIAYCKGKEINTFILIGGREEIRKAIDVVEKVKPEWMVFMSESYMEMRDKDDETPYVVGSLEERFKNGDKRVKEVITIQVYNKSGKIFRLLDKKTLEKVVPDSEEFDGFLTVSDVERVFW